MKKLMLLICVWFLPQAQAEEMEGVLVYEYGDSHVLGGESHVKYHLQDGMRIVPLDMSEAFLQKMPINQWLGKRVSVHFKAALKLNGEVQAVQSIQLLEGARGGITGSQPWVSILCKFSDVSDEPKALPFFQDMYANQPAGLDHYWREVSYDQIDVVGSTAVDWVELPSPQTTYIPVPGSGSNSDRGLLFNDCTTAADPFINFATGAGGSSFVGINMMFNDDLDCCAWGGGRSANLDGLSKFWRVTWNPPWSFANEGVIAHEMGHGFGLPHSNNSDEDDSPYDSPWDVMSSATGHGVQDPVYGRLGKHINMEFKHNLGWVDDADGFIADSMSDDVIVIDHTAMPSTANKRFARIPLSDGSHYIVEARKETGNYESNLAGTAIIIHHVVSGRQQPPWLVDEDVPPANYSNNEGVMWKVGETFVDDIDGYTVEVLSATTNGFQVRIAAQEDLIFAHGFE